jgi:hypothetical protein
MKLTMPANKRLALFRLHKSMIVSFVYALSIASHVMFINYFVELRRKNCPCADDWRNSALIALFSIILFFNLLHLFVGHTSAIATYILSSVVIASTILGVTYLQRLQDIDCQVCSKSPVRTLFNMVVNYRALAYIILIIFIIYEAIVLTVFMLQHQNY